MRLSEYTDYTLRVLMCCAAHPERLLTIAEIAEALQVSKNNLMKIVNDLGRQGLLETTRGRGGGIRLGKPAKEIRVGDVVRASETDFRLVECFDADTDTCVLTPQCRLKGALHKALRAYFCGTRHRHPGRRGEAAAPGRRPAEHALAGAATDDAPADPRPRPA
jgi:Rrf2 family nitric oxide-sensitive transcriptional repressor